METFTGIDQTSRATWSFFVSNVVAVERASSPTKAPTTLMLLLLPCSCGLELELITVMRAGLVDMCRSRKVGEFHSHRTSPHRLQDRHHEEDPVGAPRPQNGWLRRRR